MGPRSPPRPRAARRRVGTPAAAAATRGPARAPRSGAGTAGRRPARRGTGPLPSLFRGHLPGNPVERLVFIGGEAADRDLCQELASGAGIPAVIARVPPGPARPHRPVRRCRPSETTPPSRAGRSPWASASAPRPPGRGGTEPPYMIGQDGRGGVSPPLPSAWSSGAADGARRGAIPGDISYRTSVRRARRNAPRGKLATPPASRPANSGADSTVQPVVVSLRRSDIVSHSTYFGSSSGLYS